MRKILIITLLILFILIIFNYNKKENATNITDADSEAIQNISSLYNTLEKPAIFNNITTTANATIKGNIDVSGNATFNKPVIFNDSITVKKQITLTNNDGSKKWFINVSDDGQNINIAPNKTDNNAVADTTKQMSLSSDGNVVFNGMLDINENLRIFRKNTTNGWILHIPQSHKDPNLLFAPVSNNTGKWNNQIKFNYGNGMAVGNGFYGNYIYSDKGGFGNVTQAIIDRRNDGV